MMAITKTETTEKNADFTKEQTLVAQEQTEELQRELRVLQAMRREVQPNDFIGLWGFQEAAVRYNVLTQVIRQVRNTIRVRERV